MDLYGAKNKNYLKNNKELSFLFKPDEELNGKAGVEYEVKVDCEFKSKKKFSIINFLIFY